MSHTVGATVGPGHRSAQRVALSVSHMPWRAHEPHPPVTPQSAAGSPGALGPASVGEQAPAGESAEPSAPVSYTHLTLPTIYSV